MKVIRVYTTYSYCVCTEVELPEDKSMDDIKDVGMYFGRGEIDFDDGSILKFEEEEYQFNSKRPNDIEWDDGGDWGFE